MKIKDLSIMALLLSLLIVFSKISIQIGPIPVTLQTFAVIILGYILKAKKAFIVILTYIVMGLLGIPVFSTGGGIHYIYQPSFGFIIGFLISSLITGIKTNKKYSLYLQGIIGLLIIDLIGLIYMYLISKFYLLVDHDILYIINIGLTPFIIKDLISVVLATLMYLRIQPVINPKYETIKLMGWLIHPILLYKL